MKKITLFCLPYAGGMAMAFYKWKALLNPAIDFQPIELAGRGKRLATDFYVNLDEAVADVLSIIQDKIFEKPYAILGHSMGSMIAYALAQRLIQENHAWPEHVFFSGCGIPVRETIGREMYHNLDDENFIEKVNRLGGIPGDFFQQPELKDHFLPILKNDFKIVETFDYSRFQPVKPFPFNISVFLGKDEDLKPELAYRWKDYTQKLCSLFFFKGNHFFINSDRKNVCQVINHTLDSFLNQSCPAMMKAGSD